MPIPTTSVVGYVMSSLRDFAYPETCNNPYLPYVYIVNACGFCLKPTGMGYSTDLQFGPGRERKNR